MQLVIAQIGGEHRCVVLGGSEDAKFMRTLGVSLFGYIDGIQNKSRTLASRIDRMMTESNFGQQIIFAWGWRSAVALSNTQTKSPIMAFVDGVDRAFDLSDKSMTIISPSIQSTEPLTTELCSSIHVCEPLIGLKPVSIIPDRNAVNDLLGVGRTKIISILGETASVGSIISMLIRMKSVHAKVVFVLPEMYQCRQELISRAEFCSVDNLVVELPPSLRSVDVLVSSDGAWAPDSPDYAQSSSVLGTLRAAWEGIPLAASKNQAASGIPIIGKRIGWATDELQIGAWLMNLLLGSDTALKQALELAYRVRAIASPSRFIEGIQMRMPSAARFGG